MTTTSLSDKKLGIRSRIFHHRATEYTERKKKIAGGVSPRPPFLNSELFKILGVLGVKPLASPKISVFSVALW